jgi:hypothetical protein
MAEWKQFLVEQLHTHAHAIPFMLATRRATDGIALPAKLNLTRVLEALIITAISGGFGVYVAQMKMETEFANMKKELAEFKVYEANHVAEVKADLTARDNRIENEVLSHITGKP